MDITSLYYFREVAKELHITNTAIRLFVSQQTLSNHIQRLEDYYGVKLFYRKPKLRLTDAGEKMLIFAEDMLSEETKLKDILSDIEKQDKGILRVGASAIRANRCFPTILESFSKEYPNVEIRLTDYVSSKLEELIATGDLDLAICVENTPYPGLISKPLPADQIYLCVSDDLLHKYYGDMSETIKNISIDGANIRYFAKLPFYILNPPNRLGGVISKCFNEANCIPNVYISSTYTYMALTLCFQGLVACLSTQMCIYNRQNVIPDNMNIFPLLYHNAPQYQPLYLVYHPKHYISRFTQRFMDLVEEYFTNLNHMKVSCKANTSAKKKL